MPNDRLSQEQQQWVLRVAPRVRQIARAIRSQIGILSIEEFESAGNEALVKAALRYDPSTGVPFQGYAYLRIRGAMIDAVRAENPTIRRQRRALRAMAVTQSLYEEETRKASIGAPSDPRSLKERVEAAAELIRKTTTAVQLSKLSPADPEATGDTNSEAADEKLIAVETKKHLLGALSRCDPDEQALIDALYHRELNMHMYAAEIGVAVSTVSRRHARLLRKLGGMLRAHTGSAHGELAARRP